MPQSDGDIYDPEYDAELVSQEQVKLARDMDTARGILEMRKGAYRRVFVEGQPSREDREVVMKDLNDFCRFESSAFHENERIHVLLTGRQEVATRINDFTRLSVDALTVKYTAAQQRTI